MSETEMPKTAANATYSASNPHDEHKIAIGGIKSTVAAGLENSPVWLAVLITAAVVLLLSSCISCICRHRCRRRETTKSKKGHKVSPLDDMKPVDVLDNSYQEKIQPDVRDLPLCLDETVSDSYRSEVKLGRLHFSIGYDRYKEQLTVQVLEAADLPLLDISGSSDPYVKVRLLPDTRIRLETSVHRRNRNPVFNESFSVKLSVSELSSRVMSFTVHDLTAHDQIGQVLVSLNSINVEQIVDEWRELQHPTKELENIPHLGDIYLSLRYVPSSGQLTVLVLEAKCLKKMDIGGLSDPYVKIWLMFQDKRLKKKRTSVKKCTLNPYFNESFTFQVACQQIQKVSLVITVVDYDRLGASEPIGRCILGHGSSGSGLRQWSDMLANPGRPVPQWHNLHEMPGKK